MTSFWVRNKHNTPGIIKYPFWQMTFNDPEAHYVCINFEDAFAPPEIHANAICIQEDIGHVLLLSLSGRSFENK